MTTVAPSGVVLLPCARCGAALPVDPAELRVECAFCGEETAFAQAQFQDQRVLPAVAQQVEGEGRRALEQELREFFRPGWLSLAVPYFVLAVLTGLVKAVTRAAELHDTPPLSWWPVFAWSALGIVGVAFLALRLSAPKRARRAVDLQQGPGPLGKSHCPACNGLVAVPRQTVMVACHYCDAPLLADRGLLVQWVEDAQQRATAWKGEARRVALENWARASKVQRLVYAGVALTLSGPLWMALLAGVLRLVLR